MKIVDIPFFVELGASLESAEKVDPEGALFDTLLTFYPLGQRLQGIVNGQHGRLAASEHYVQDLLNDVTTFEQNHFRDQEGKWRSPGEDERSEYEVGSLVGKVKQLRTILIAELRTAASFTVTRTGIFDVNLLVNEAHRAFDDLTLSKLDSTICAEIDAAGKCLAFNLFTAAGFHSMRAVERVIKRYLSDFLNQEEISKLNNWGHYLQALERLNKEQNGATASNEAIALLRQIKDIYRNPVIHPERVLNGVEATTIFHSTIAAISRVVSEFKEAHPSIPGLLGGGLLGSLIAKGGPANRPADKDETSEAA